MGTCKLVLFFSLYLREPLILCQTIGITTLNGRSPSYYVPYATGPYDDLDPDPTTMSQQQSRESELGYISFQKQIPSIFSQPSSPQNSVEIELPHLPKHPVAPSRIAFVRLAQVAALARLEASALPGQKDKAMETRWDICFGQMMKVCPTLRLTKPSFFWTFKEYGQPLHHFITHLISIQLTI